MSHQYSSPTPSWSFQPESGGVHSGRGPNGGTTPAFDAAGTSPSSGQHQFHVYDAARSSRSQPEIHFGSAMPSTPPGNPRAYRASPAADLPEQFPQLGSVRAAHQQNEGVAQSFHDHSTRSTPNSNSTHNHNHNTPPLHSARYGSNQSQNGSVPYHSIPIRSNGNSNAAQPKDSNRSLDAMPSRAQVGTPRSSTTVVTSSAMFSSKVKVGLMLATAAVVAGGIYYLYNRRRRAARSAITPTKAAAPPPTGTEQEEEELCTWDGGEEPQGIVPPSPLHPSDDWEVVSPSKAHHPSPSVPVKQHGRSNNHNADYVTEAAFPSLMASEDPAAVGVADDDDGDQVEEDYSSNGGASAGASLNQYVVEEEESRVIIH